MAQQCKKPLPLIKNKKGKPTKRRSEIDRRSYFLCSTLWYFLVSSHDTIDMQIHQNDTKNEWLRKISGDGVQHVTTAMKNGFKKVLMTSQTRKPRVNLDALPTNAPATEKKRVKLYFFSFYFYS